jgi:hypothetical protein
MPIIVATAHVGGSPLRPVKGRVSGTNFGARRARFPFAMRED